MKTLLASLFAVLALSGCIAVPYAPAPAGYDYGPGYSYGPGYYYGPPAGSITFGYTYRDGGYRHHRWYR